MGSGRKRWVKITLWAGLIVLLLIGFGIAGGLLATRSVGQIGTTFMEALAAQDYATVFAMSTDSLRSEIGSPTDIGQTLEQQGLFVDQWRITQRYRDSNRGEVSGTVTFHDGRKGAFVIRMESVNDQWLVLGFSLQPDIK